jgi:uncharacterized protein (DUF58 family)
MERSFGRIQLSPGSLIYLMVTALITFAVLYTQANLLFWTLGLVFGALGVSLIAALVTLNSIEVQRLVPPRGVAGEPLILRYHLTNRSKFACFSVEIIETWASHRRSKRARQTAGPLSQKPPMLTGRPFGWVLHLGPDQSIQADAPCWPRRRGPLRFEKIIIRSGFPFGILRKAVHFQQTAEVLIHPPIRRLNRQAALTLCGYDISNARHADRGGGMDEFFGLRPYRPGDNYKLIDWKHSARSNNLVSREMTKPRPPRMMILLDLTTPPPSQETLATAPDNPAWIMAQEEAISLTGSLVREAYLHGIHVGLGVQGVASTNLPMHHNPAHRTRLLDNLASLDLTDTQQTQNTQPTHPTVIVRPDPTTQDNPNQIPNATILNVTGNGRRHLRQQHAHEQAHNKGRKPLTTT